MNITSSSSRVDGNLNSVGPVLSYEFEAFKSITLTIFLVIPKGDQQKTNTTFNCRPNTKLQNLDFPEERNRILANCTASNPSISILNGKRIGVMRNISTNVLDYACRCSITARLDFPKGWIDVEMHSVDFENFNHTLNVVTKNKCMKIATKLELVYIKNDLFKSYQNWAAGTVRTRYRGPGFRGN